MGYYVTMDIGGLEIPQENWAACLDAINNLPKEKEYSFCWVSYPEDGFKTLTEALTAWRFDVEDSEDLDALVISYFDGEKLGDEEVLFNTIAPFVKSGAVVECHGEDHAAWRFLFEDGKCIEQQAKITWV